MAAGLLLYAGVGPDADAVAAGAGLTCSRAPAWRSTPAPRSALAMSAIPLQRAGLASGVVNLARLVGITVGVAVLGSAMAADRR